MKHTTIKEIKLATQYKQKSYQLTSSFLKLMWDGSSSYRSFLAQKLLKTHYQVRSEIQESLRLLVQHAVTTEM